MKIPILACLTLSAFVCFAATFPALAQERTAGGALNSEASWGALKSMIGRTDGNVAILKTDVNAMKACGAQKKIWTGTQCVNGDLVDSIVACGKQGQVFSGTGCSPASPRWYQSHSLSFSDEGTNFQNLYNSYYAQYNPTIKALRSLYPSLPACSGNMVPAGRACTPGAGCYLQQSDSWTSGKETEINHQKLNVQVYSCG